MKRFLSLALVAVIACWPLTVSAAETITFSQLDGTTLVDGQTVLRHAQTVIPVTITDDSGQTTAATIAVDGVVQCTWTSGPSPSSGGCGWQVPAKPDQAYVLTVTTQTQSASITVYSSH